MMNFIRIFTTISILIWIGLGMYEIIINAIPITPYIMFLFAITNGLLWLKYEIETKKLKNK